MATHHLFGVQKLVNCAQQLEGTEWLDEIMLNSQRLPLGLILRASPCGQHDDGNVSSTRIGAENPRDAKPVAFGQRNVKKNQIWWLGQGGLHCDLTIAGNDNVEISRSERYRHESLNRRLIIDQQDPLPHRSLPPHF